MSATYCLGVKLEVGLGRTGLGDRVIAGDSAAVPAVLAALAVEGGPPVGVADLLGVRARGS
jgi:hypothetical protein